MHTFFFRLLISGVGRHLSPIQAYPIMTTILKLLSFLVVLVPTNARVSTALSPNSSSNDALVACSSKKCVHNALFLGLPTTETVQVNFSYGIRCCADTPMSDFAPAPRTCPNLWVTSRDESGDCVRGTTYFAGLQQFVKDLVQGFVQYKIILMIVHTLQSVI